MAKKKQPELIQHNFVAKHMHEVNKSQVFVDRKKNAKRGYSKHKQGRYSELSPLLFLGCIACCLSFRNVYGATMRVASFTISPKPWVLK